MKKSGGNDLRYIWLSTPNKEGSASCGCPLHFVRPLTKSTLSPKPILVTEGALKTEAVQAFCPRFSVVAIGGISSSHSELIEASRFSPLIVGFDNDFFDNLQLLRQFTRFLCARFSDAKKHCYDPDLKILTWTSKFKGIDDALIHNQTINQLTFSQWLKLLNDSLRDKIYEQLCYSLN